MRKKCRRKVWALVDPITHAKEGASILHPDVLDKFRFSMLSVIEAFAKGLATQDDWQYIVDMLNVAETMAKGKSGRKVGPEVIDICAAVSKEMEYCKQRFKNTGKFGITGQGLQNLRELLEYHCLQCSSISRREFEKWVNMTAAPIKPSRNVVEIV